MLDIVFSHPVFQSTLHETFYLQHNDLDLQNILTDTDGNITGIIDWYGSLAVPSYVAHAAVPRFLRRDWFPQDVTNIPHITFRNEHYREVYAAAMNQAGNPDALYTSKSAIYQAALTMIYEGGNRCDFVEKMLEAVPSFRLPKREFVEFLGSTQGCKVEKALKAKLYKLLQPELPAMNLADLVSDLAALCWMHECDQML